MQVRAVVRRVHRGIGLGFGALLVLTSVSGALIVFGPEIDAVLTPRLFRATAGPEVGLDRACQAVVRAFPGRAVIRVASTAMPRAHGVYEVRLAGVPALVAY